ncbi:MAG: orotidine-5'-phosphate decarboxylase [bacterium]|nr:orotidine-5'-phosphate decarboxylase [bacterium]
MNLKPHERIIVALDGLGLDGSLDTIDELTPYAGVFKVGFDLITRQKADIVAAYAAGKDAKAFWDSKLFDIPNTVGDAAATLAAMPSVGMFNVHCFGGSNMMRAARQAVDEVCLGGSAPSILGVTILTSFDYAQLFQMGLLPPLTEKQRGQDNGKSAIEVMIGGLVLRLAVLAKNCGLDGVIASPKEIRSIRQACGSDFLIVTPGVRPEWAAANDQKRVMTPGEAIAAGADYLVIGRPILKPPPEIGSRVKAAQLILDEIAEAMSTMQS